MLGDVELWRHGDLELEGFAGVPKQGSIEVIGGPAVRGFGEVVLSSAWPFGALGTWGSGALGGLPECRIRVAGGPAVWAFGELVLSTGGPVIFGSEDVLEVRSQGSWRSRSVRLWRAGAVKCLGVWSFGDIGIWSSVGLPECRISVGGGSAIWGFLELVLSTGGPVILGSEDLLEVGLRVTEGPAV